MSMLDYSVLPSFLDRYFSANYSGRLVGKQRSYDSGYVNIIRFFGANPFDSSLVKLSYLPGIFQIQDGRIQAYSSRIVEQLRKEGRLYEGPTVLKLIEAKFENPAGELIIQEASYEDFAGTCFALDSPDQLFRDDGSTLREYYKRTYPANQNPLAICFGISGLVLLSEGSDSYILQVRRGRKLASMPESYGASVAGAVDFKSGYKNLHELMIVSLSEEIAEEINLTAGEYQITPLAYSEEICRGEHPQLFCLITTPLCRWELEKRISQIPVDRREFDRYEFVPFEKEVGSNEEYLSRYNFEGKMNYYLVEEYLSLI